MTLGASEATVLPHIRMIKVEAIIRKQTDMSHMAPLLSPRVNFFIRQVYQTNRLERISDGQVKSECLLERNIEISVYAGVIRGMQTISEVTSDHHDTDIDPKADAGSECDILKESRTFEQASRAQGVAFEKPDVAGIKEDSAVQNAYDGEPVFHIHFELERTRLVEIAVALAHGWTVAAGADGAHRERADGVGSSDVELLGVGYF